MSKHPTLDLTVERDHRRIARCALRHRHRRHPDRRDEPRVPQRRVGRKEQRPAVGARFKGQNELGDSKWTTKPTVTAAERGAVFEFKVPMGFGPTWRYEFHPVAEGTRVVESVRQTKPSPWFIRRAQRKAGVHDRAANVTEGMKQTLANLERLATA